MDRAGLPPCCATTCTTAESAPGAIILPPLLFEPSWSDATCLADALHCTCPLCFWAVLLQCVPHASYRLRPCGLLSLAACLPAPFFPPWIHRALHSAAAKWGSSRTKPV